MLTVRTRSSAITLVELEVRLWILPA